MTQLTSCPDDQTVAQRAADHVTRAVERARSERGVAHVALSGGTTPGLTYEMLGARPEELADTHIWFADERCVPPDDEESNYLLAERTLIGPAKIPGERIHRMRGELGPDDGAGAYAEELSGALPTAGSGADPGIGSGSGGALPVLDLIVLGIGPDGHVASLFPGAATLDADPALIALGVSDAPKPPPERITLTLSILYAARECLLLATGPSKADAVSAMLGEPSRHVPASLLRRERLTVILDDAAAPQGPPSAGLRR